METRYVLLAIAVLGVFACSPEDPASSVAPQFSTGCGFEGGEGCQYLFFDPKPIQTQFAMVADTTPDPSWPEWNGEVSVFAGVPYHCPLRWPTPTFRVYIPENGETVLFHVPGFAPRDLSYVMSPDPSTGYPRARYLMPPFMEVPDLTGKYKAVGGHIYAKCGVQWVFQGATAAEKGPMIGYDFDGEIWGNFEQSVFGDAGGWGFKDASISVESGVGAGWESAVATWLAHEQCTPGYEIWIDGIMVCNSDGVRTTA